MYDQLINKETAICVVGLGYVGLPLALEFARNTRVIGFDINEERIGMMRNHIDPSRELEKSDFKDRDVSFTSKIEEIKDARFYIVAVPTPINNMNLPDLGPVLAASRTVGKALKKGDYVVYESTVYPGCTEDDCVPILEELSGLKMGTDFKVGYSPERINPGDKVHTLRTITKVVSGCDAEALEQVSNVYKIVVDAGVFPATSIKVAEACKITENTQRDANIALVNELSLILNKMGISTLDVLEAAGSKWNFLKFSPGLVGGHCIGVDPYYLVYKAKKIGYYSKVISSARYINDSMGFYVGKETVKKILELGHNALESKVLVMGATFKENVSDIRNSKVVDIIRELESFSVQVDIIDPYADSKELKDEYGFGLIKEPAPGEYDAIVVAVPHDQFKSLDETYFKSLLKGGMGVIMDIKGIYRNKFKELVYWSL
ncbi:MAG: nucleotide sugar dehydrogenase [Crocinitomicaceae bacterium]|nr:nucleotide sugar dehydrogenase [Crocinitomicaceae bacterium]